MLVIFDYFSEYINLAILDFILLYLQFFQLKLLLKRFYVLVELIFKGLELIFKFLEVTFKREQHAVEVVYNSVNLNFHIGTQGWL